MTDGSGFGSCKAWPLLHCAECYFDTQDANRTKDSEAADSGAYPVTGSLFRTIVGVCFTASERHRKIKPSAVVTEWSRE